MMAFLIGKFGTEPLAAHQIAIQSASISFMIPLGIGLAASIRVGNAIGRGSRSDAAEAGFAAMLVALSYAVCSGLIFWFLPETLLSLYFDIDDPENAATTKIAVSFLRVAATFQLFDAIQVVASCSLRGLKDTRAAMLLSLLSYWVIGLTACLLLCYTFGFGPIGLWYGLIVALGAAAVTLTTRFYHQVGS
ncbi:MATE family efflux transporter [Mariniblastus sp.]|nr:MATE family efflux transporter [Mariniblastus sp.]